MFVTSPTCPNTVPRLANPFCPHVRSIHNCKRREECKFLLNLSEGDIDIRTILSKVENSLLLLCFIVSITEPFLLHLCLCIVYFYCLLPSCMTLPVSIFVLFVCRDL